MHIRMFFVQPRVRGSGARPPRRTARAVSRPHLQPAPPQPATARHCPPLPAVPLSSRRTLAIVPPSLPLTADDLFISTGLSRLEDVTIARAAEPTTKGLRGATRNVREALLGGCSCFVTQLMQVTIQSPISFKGIRGPKLVAVHHMEISSFLVLVEPIQCRAQRCVKGRRPFRRTDGPAPNI